MSDDATMRAVTAPVPGGPEALTLVERPRPKPGAARNPRPRRRGRRQPARTCCSARANTRRRRAPATCSGLEVAGEVVERGAGATLHALGARR